MWAQFGIEDDIFRGLGMCLQRAKTPCVITRALLANLRSNNDCGLHVPLMKRRKEDMKRDNNNEEKEMITAEDITEIELTQAEYY